VVCINLLENFVEHPRRLPGVHRRRIAGRVHGSRRQIWQQVVQGFNSMLLMETVLVL